FTLPRAMPGDPLAALNDPDNSLFVTDPVVRHNVEAYYGLDKPLPQQFLHYVTRLAHGDLGFSIARKTPVTDLDRSLMAGMTVAQAVPEYAMAAVLLILFAVVFPIFPLAGARTPFAQQGRIASWLDIGRHLVLPATALTLSLLGSKFLLVRNTMISTLGADYMVLARAKGLPDRLLKYRHAGRNALLPFLTVVGIQ